MSFLLALATMLRGSKFGPGDALIATSLKLRGSAFQEPSEVLRQRGRVGDTVFRAYTWMIHATVGMESFFSFKLCHFS
jgi:hypothetical protein